MRSLRLCPLCLQISDNHFCRRNIEACCRTYETGSFTRAARLLAVTPQATSRSAARLVRRLGVTLFRRTTRSLAPTEPPATRRLSPCHIAAATSPVTPPVTADVAARARTRATPLTTRHRSG
ncbi:helix-turn-helix domain-containing protein [Sorangium sp. So ce406]|uniref:helix-turn-helix domain-containing protein n=1 Tax=Sorangium sp. So ce406 TaxID=3133311 RepID=UPI003F5C09A7